MAVSEEIRLPSNGAPLPLGHLLPGLSAHAEDLLKLRIAQPALALVGAHAGRPRHACSQLLIRPGVAVTRRSHGREHGVRRRLLLLDLADEREPAHRFRELLLLGAEGGV